MRSAASSARVTLSWFRRLRQGQGCQEQKDRKVRGTQIAEQTRNHEGPTDRPRLQLEFCPLSNLPSLHCHFRRPGPRFKVPILGLGTHQRWWALHLLAKRGIVYNWPSSLLRCHSCLMLRISPQQEYHLQRSQAWKFAHWQWRLPKAYRFWLCQVFDRRKNFHHLWNTRVHRPRSHLKSRPWKGSWLVDLGCTHLRDARWNRPLQWWWPYGHLQKHPQRKDLIPFDLR